MHSLCPKERQKSVGAQEQPPVTDHPDQIQASFPSYIISFVTETTTFRKQGLHLTASLIL